MTRNVAVYRALQSMASFGLEVFALTCAERGSAIFRSLATAEDAEWFSQVLDTAWKAAAGEFDEDELAELVDEFQAHAESFGTDDAESREFFVLQSAMLAMNAIVVHLHPSAARAETSGQTLETLLGAFDFKLGGEEARIVRAGETPPPPGRLQRTEQEAQAAVVEAVTALTGPQEVTRTFLEEVRERCRPLREEIAVAAATVGERAGWDANPL
ncbi:hypothetical protein AB0C68_15440 [Streptomyces tendae]|uniref:hypothetical protein n=1 Tax=Streptomyces tendae TaxID=1932 RepID=UPI0034074787